MIKGRQTVYLMTETYPLAGPDDPFLHDEVKALAEVFDLVLIPTTNTGGDCAPLPAKVETRLGLAATASSRRARARSLIRATFSPLLYREILGSCPASLRTRSLATILVRLSRSFRVEAWVRSQLIPGMEPGTSLMYSWWSFSAAYGAGRALHGTGIPFLTRAHGYDLFADQEVIGFIPFQRQLIEVLSLMACDSHTGANYLRERYPDLAGKVTTSYLGTEDQCVLSEASLDGVLRIVTCSSNTTVKRVDLLARGLSQMASTSPDIEFHWTHIGVGPLAGELKSLVNNLPGLVGRCTITGYLTEPEWRQQFTGRPVDLFVNVSSSEGLPVSLMEAASFGVPMMATKVGGNPEIVNEVNGVLLDRDPCPMSVAEAISAFARLTLEERAAKRAASRATFERDFDAEVNYGTFITFLKAMTT
jgi:glycosyltransferase involved in cell wall biosynthesis